MGLILLLVSLLMLCGCLLGLVGCSTLCWERR